jgi:hypothetical protein
LHATTPTRLAQCRPEALALDLAHVDGVVLAWHGRGPPARAISPTVTCGIRRRFATTVLACPSAHARMLCTPTRRPMFIRDSVEDDYDEPC